MRIAAGSGQRANLFDRNPLTIQGTYDTTGIAPHTVTTRWTYTVPSNRKALIAWTDMVWTRLTAAGAAARVTIRIVLGSGAVPSMRTINSNAVDATNTATGQVGQTLLAGESVSGTTQDNSTGGTCDYTISAGGTEFDA